MPHDEELGGNWCSGVRNGFVEQCVVSARVTSWNFISDPVVLVHVWRGECTWEALCFGCSPLPVPPWGTLVQKCFVFVERFNIFYGKKNEDEQGIIISIHLPKTLLNVPFIWIFRNPYFPHSVQSPIMLFSSHQSNHRNTGWNKALATAQNSGPACSSQALINVSQGKLNCRWAPNYLGWISCFKYPV